MLRRERLLFALAFMTAAAMAGTASCGGGDSTGTGAQGGATSSTSATSSSSTTSSSTSTSSSGSGGSGGSGNPVAFVPPNPVNLCPVSTVLAVNSLAFGEGDSGQWKQYGFNIDGLPATAPSTDLCQPVPGPNNEVNPKADNGIDNSFGANLLPIILGVDPNWTTNVNNGISIGTFTVLLEMECLPPTENDAVFVTKLFGGENLGMAPKWDGTDKWPVLPDLLNNPNDPQSSSIVFNQCSLTNNQFYSGKNVQVVLTVPVENTSIKLTLNAAQMKMDLTAAHDGAVSGMIGGVLNTQDFMLQVSKVANLLGLCDPSELAPLLTDVEQASDIMADGTQDPTQTCNGISMGLGFTMLPAQIGVVGQPAPQGAPCPDDAGVPPP